jgi:hypothetical protein
MAPDAGTMSLDNGKRRFKVAALFFAATVVSMICTGYVSPNPNAAGVLGELTGKLTGVAAITYAVLWRSRRGLATLVCSIVCFAAAALVLSAAIWGRSTQQRVAAVTLGCVADLKTDAERLRTQLAEVDLDDALSAKNLSREMLTETQRRLKNAETALDAYQSAYELRITETLAEVRAIDARSAADFSNGLDKSTPALKQGLRAWREYLTTESSVIGFLLERVDHIRRVGGKIVFGSQREADTFNASLERLDALQKQMNELQQSANANVSGLMPEINKGVWGLADLKQRIMPPQTK